MHDLFPAWTLLPFALLVVGIAALPLAFPQLWTKVWAQAGFAFSRPLSLCIACWRIATSHCSKRSERTRLSC
jgi:hypothetical protein